MRSSRVAPLLGTIVVAAPLAGCTAGAPDEDAPVPPRPGAHRVLGSFVMHVQPEQRRATIRRLPSTSGTSGTSRAAPRLSPQHLDSLPIVADDVAGSGPDYTVELVTDQDPSRLVNTYQLPASGNCPAGSWCADVTFTHFYPGLDLSAVYVQITGIVDPNGDVDHLHDAKNGVTSTPFGLDLGHGAWLYTSPLETLAQGATPKLTWAFDNPDNQDYYVYLDAKAALYPMLWFDAGGVTQTAPLVAGKPAILHYAYARNTACRGDDWIMNGFLKGYNVDIHQTSFPGSAADTYFDVHMMMPFGPGVDFWFNNEDGTGCQAWDSNGGVNFNYAVDDTNTRIHFAGPAANVTPYWSPAWQVYADSGVHAGVTIGVDYEIDRVLCGSLDRYGRVPLGVDVTMHYRYDSKDGPYTAIPLLGLPHGVPGTIGGSSGRLYMPPALDLPPGASQLWVYFDSTGPNCQKYDSGPTGGNFMFPL